MNIQALSSTLLVLKKILVLVGSPVRKWFYFSLVFQIVSGTFEGLSATFLFDAISSLSTNLDTGIHRSLLMDKIVSLTNHLPRGTTFMAFLLGAMVTQVLRGFMGYLSTLCFVKFIDRSQNSLVQRYGQKLVLFSFAFFNTLKKGELVSLAKVPFDGLIQYFNSMAVFMQAFVFICALITMLFFISVKFTIFVFLIFFIFYVFQKTMLRKIENSSRQFSESLNEYMHLLSQIIQGMREVISFHKHDYILERVKSLSGQVTKSNFILNKKAAKIAPINEMFGVAAVSVSAIVGFFVLLDKGESSIALLVTYLVILFRIANRLPVWIGAFTNMAIQSGSMSRFIELLEYSSEYLQKGGREVVKKLPNILEFSNVNYTYDGKNTVLNDCNLNIKKGQSVAIVGPSGAGKSTIIDLILGLYSCTDGHILIDGVSLNEVELASWRKHIGVISQDITLFQDTVYQNIIFGEPGYSQADVKKIAHIAGCSEFIEKLPEKYNTILGERGYKLSGGEKQRLALARALLKRPKFIIMDEATSALDTTTERNIVEALVTQYSDTTMLIVAHRLSTITHCDVIHVLEKGRVVEHGSHEELMSKKGLYHAMWSAQNT